MNWDESLTHAIHGFAGQSTLLDWFALTLSSPSMLWTPGILLTGYWIWLSWREALIAAPLLAGLIGGIDFIGAQLKHAVARPRPCMVLPDFYQLQACGKTFSFPSNHAVNTAAAAAFLQVLYPRSGWISWPLVGLIGLTRVFVGAHYATDVVGGWAIGGLCGAGAAWLLLYWRQFRRPSPVPAADEGARINAKRSN